jgi:hypothetical protein
MLHGIEVNVVDTPLQVGVVANGMLPITTRKSALDETPAQRKIGISLRQRPDGM